MGSFCPSPLLNRVNYANIVWASSSQTKLKKMLTKQRHVAQVIFNVNKETSTRPLFKELNALNIYQINLLQVLIFMQRVKTSKSPRVFSTYFQPINHIYL